MDSAKVQRRIISNDKKFYCIFIWMLVISLVYPAIIIKALKDNATSNYCVEFEEGLVAILKISPLPHLFGGREGCLVVIAEKKFIKSNWYSGDGFVIAGTNLYGQEMSVHLRDSRECITDEIFNEIRETPFLFNVTVKGYTQWLSHSKDMTAKLSYSCS